MLQLLLQRGDFLNIDISQGSVATQLRYGGIFKYTLLQIYQRVRQWKNFENRFTFGEVMGIFLASCFLTQSVVETGAVETALYYVNEQLNSYIFT